jgi:hypothetical protein
MSSFAGMETDGRRASLSTPDGDQAQRGKAAAIVPKVSHICEKDVSQSRAT